MKETNLNSNNENSLLWESGENCIKIIKGDILNYALGKKTKKERIVVIPVNTAFDVHVSTKLEADPAPLVSNQTLHGKFLVRAYKGEYSEEELLGKIRRSLRADGFLKGSPKKMDLPIGTIATLDMGNATIFMLAVSKFDDKNRAHSTKKDVQTAIKKLIDYYDDKGQGYDLYLPLIGTGRSRANLGNQESLDLIIDTLLKNKNLLHGKINIVALPEVIDKIIVRKEEGQK